VEDNRKQRGVKDEPALEGIPIAVVGIGVAGEIAQAELGSLVLEGNRAKKTPF
jgi:hypothetical protein